MNVTEERINLWARSISETEEDKCQNAISQITNVIRKRFGNNVTIIRQGSHRNRTNIRADSDVDLSIVHDSYYFPNIESLSESDKQLHNQYKISANYKFEQFKNDVHQVLKEEFGFLEVERKNKCIRVKGNTNRVYADVVPAYGYKRYRGFEDVEAEGIAFIADDSLKRVASFPDHHYKNGVLKNDATSKVYKAVVRILKNLRNELEEKKIITVDNLLPSFLIECLVWNTPNSCFENTTYREDARSVALNIWSDMKEMERSKKYAEVCDLHWLFPKSSHTPAQVEAFMLKAWSYLEP